MLGQQTDRWLIVVDKQPLQLYARPYALRIRELSVSPRKDHGVVVGNNFASNPQTGPEREMVPR